MLTFVLPIPPTLNHCYLTTRSGRRILTDEGRAYVEGAALVARNAAQREGWCYESGARLVLELRLFFPRNNRDLDNAFKLLLDSLAAGLDFDDRQIKALHAYSAVDKATPRCEVGIGVLVEEEVLL